MFSLSDLVRITGTKRRSIQLWAEAGAIRAEIGTERQGSGIHRNFTKCEAKIACILAIYARNGRPIGHLIKIGDIARAELNKDVPAIAILKGMQQTEFLSAIQLLKNSIRFIP